MIMTNEDGDRLNQYVPGGPGHWEKCPTGSANLVPDVCPTGAFRITSGKDFHEHWVPDVQPIDPEVYWWMGCVIVVVRKQPDSESARTFVLQPATGKFWWKSQPYPFPAEAVRMPLPREDGFDAGAESHATTYRRGYVEGFRKGAPVADKIREILLSDGSLSARRTDSLELDDSATYDAARLVRIADVLGVPT